MTCKDFTSLIYKEMTCDLRKNYLVTLLYLYFQTSCLLLLNIFILQDVERADYKESLLARVKSALSSDQQDDTSDIAKEAQITSCVSNQSN